MKYGTIVADPPWRYQKNNGMGIRTAEGHYETMSPAEVAALPVGELAAPDAHLYVWVTNPILTRQRWDMIGSGPDVMDMVRGWGFEPKTVLTWHKGGGGMGWYFRGDTEHVVFAVRGEAGIEAERRTSNLFAAPRSGHSAKPESFLDMVESVSPGPYLELFARRARFGWEYWGRESLQTTELDQAMSPSIKWKVYPCPHCGADNVMRFASAEEDICEACHEVFVPPLDPHPLVENPPA